MIGKVVVSTVSVILVVGVIIGIVTVTRPNGKDDDGNGADMSSMKLVASICASTSYQNACMQSLTPVAKNSSATPKDYIQAALQVTIDEIKLSMNNSANLVHATNDSMTQMALDDCKELLEFSIDELQESLKSVNESDLSNLDQHSIDILSWLSAVVSYQETCLDGFPEQRFQKTMQQNLLNATQLTSNALAIVADVTQMFAKLNLNPNSRRLLQEQVLGHDGFPTWFSAADRKLLGSNDAGRLPPDAVVAQDGSGQFKTIAEALNAYPKVKKGMKEVQRYVIYVKAGIYKENIIITKEKVNVYMYGDGPRKTIVTGSKSYRDGITTYKTATFSAIGKGFVARAMGFENTAGPDGHQAVALRVQSDMSAFFNIRVNGYQDSLYVQANRQFYRNCVIAGTIDFIFGDSTTVIQNSLIIVRKPNSNQQNTVTAHGKKEKRETTGLVIHNCRITPEKRLFNDRFKLKTYLGRPWKEFSKTIVMETTLEDFIQPEGWMPWDGDFALNTLFYAEYANNGAGADTSKRVTWKGYKVITSRDEAMQYTVNSFIRGYLWLKPLNVPYLPTFKR